MEIKGKIIAVLPAKSGISQRTGNDWMSQEYVIETHDQYPRKCCFNVFGKDKIDTFEIQAGEEMTVYCDIDAHEYNGRWFNSVTAWKVDRNMAAPVTTDAPVTSDQQPFASNESTTDDLPF